MTPDTGARRNIIASRWAAATALAMIGFATAMTAMGVVWSQLTPPDIVGSLWPVPGFSVAEAVVLPALVCWRIATMRRPGRVSWWAIGALAMIGLAGAMTIGIYILASLPLTIAASLIANERQVGGGQMARAAAVGGGLQAALMIAVIQFLIRYP